VKNRITHTKEKFRKGRRLKFCGTVHLVTNTSYHSGDKCPSGVLDTGVLGVYHTLPVSVGKINSKFYRYKQTQQKPDRLWYWFATSCPSVLLAV